MSEHYIEFKNVTKSYGSGNAEVKALDDVSFHIDKGEFCVLIEGVDDVLIGGTQNGVALAADDAVLHHGLHAHAGYHGVHVGTQHDGLAGDGAG